jgi:small-conductance mechanosensitive channel
LPFNEATLVNLLVKTIESLIVLVALLALGRFLKKGIFKVANRTSRNPNLSTLLSNLGYVGILAICIIWILSIYTGTGLSSLITLLGIISVAISLSVQDVLKNFVAGIFLLMEQPFKIGDRIQVREVQGKVQTIEIRTTKLLTDEGLLVIIPNSIVFTEVVTNRTASDYTQQTIYLTLKAEHSLSEVSEGVTKTFAAFGADKISPLYPPAVHLASVTDGVTKVNVEFWTTRAAPRSVKADVAAALSKALPELDLSVDKV